MKIKSVSLTSLMSQFRDWDTVLGPDEIQILADADMLLTVTIPSDDFGKLAYLSRSSQIQGKLNNLLSRLSYIANMSAIERDSYYGSLIESGEVEGREKKYIALATNPKFRDLEETNAALDTIKNHVNNVLWIMKVIVGRL